MSEKKEQSIMEKLEAMFDELFEESEDTVNEPSGESDAVDSEGGIGTIILNDENGDAFKFEFLDLIEYKKNEYVVLLPVEEEEDFYSGEVVILKVEDNGNPEQKEYTSVEDEKTLKAVYKIFKKKFRDMFFFTD